MKYSHHLGTVAGGLAIAVLTVAAAWAEDPAPPSSLPATPPATNPAAAPAPLPWLGSLNDAYAAAQRQRQPILVVVGASWCSWCHKLEDQLATPAAQQALKTWTRVRLDLDAQPDAARKLGIGPIPALRILTPTGRLIDAHDGYLPAAELADWLAARYRQAAPSPIDAQAIEAPLDAAALPAMIQALAATDAATREATIRKLSNSPALAAPAVVAAFAKGPLAARLSALELLDAWEAPLTGLDPWQPDTLTVERLNGLRTWSTSPAVAKVQNPAAETPTTLPADQLTVARLQLDRLLAATAEADIQAQRERLVRLGKPLLPEVLARISQAPTDRDRERLTALRYRLVAADTLALTWPTGFDRLASPDPQVRRAALDELAPRATPRDVPLLLELFSDADPFVRESSLRLLRKVGGTAATGALANLLRDPDPNVRAAVLKQLAETPVPAIAAQVATYAAQEKDADLVVHAVRALRTARNDAARQGLQTLLEHESWRVRAEAAEGLTEVIKRGSSNSDETRADFYAAMLRLLEDPDGFVVSRALTALEDAEKLPSLEPIAKVAERHPELASQVIQTLTSDRRPNAAALPYLTKYATSTDPTVRVAAIRSLSALAKDAAADILKKGLHDPDARVRIASATALMPHLEALSPWGRSSSGNDLPVNVAVWLAKFQSKGRPAWIDALHPDLDPLLQAQEVDERLAAALPLIALGYHDQSLPLLREAASTSDAAFQAAASALPWLPLEKRLALFTHLLALPAHTTNLPAAIHALARAQDPAAIDPLWALLERPDFDFSLAEAVHGGLRQLYLGQRYWDNSSLSAAQRKQIAADTRRKAESGPELRRLVALALALTAAPDTAADLAVKIIADPAAPPALRADAMQIHLLALSRVEAEKAALATLAAGSADSRRIALSYLARGPDAIRYLRNELYLYHQSSEFSSPPSGQLIIPMPPTDLTADLLRPLLQDPNPEIAAYAGYFMALCQDRAGLPVLLKYYRSSPKNTSEVQRLVYRAITALNDESQLPLLQEIYQTLKTDSRYEVSEFYWTIRSMQGDQVAILRKTIRQEIGMDNLR